MATRPFYRVENIPIHSCLMVASREDALAFPTGDLELIFDDETGLIQNRLFEGERLRYSTDYEETQGFSPRFQQFQTDLCKSQVEKYGLHGKTLMEIGCGKGEFLVELCELAGSGGIGIDPSYRPERTESDAAARIEFIQDLYSERYTHLRADYVCCRHTLEHIYPVREFVGMVRRTLDAHPDTVVFFELPDMERILREGAFWDVYYEHCSYFTLGSLARLFRDCDFSLLDLYRGYDDQYLMIEALPGASARDRRFDEEADLAATARLVEAFETKVPERIAELRNQVREFANAGRRPVVWGSGSKAVSYFTTLGIRDEVEWVVDINPHKHGKFLAGTGHEIVGPEFLKTYQPEAVVVMNPIYVDEIRRDLREMGLDPEVVAV